ncbi:MAG: glycosyltransferase family 4 protein [Candidatus Moraniibacteriota bacterium]
MMKKLCIVNFNMYCLFDPNSDAPMGGAELDMYMVVKGLESDCDISVITGDWGQKEVEFFGGVRVIKSFKLGIKGLLQFLRSFILFWRSLIRADADIYLSSGAGIEVGVIAFFCKLKKRQSVYRTAHLIDCDGSYVKTNGLSGLIYEYGLKNASKIVTSVREHGSILIDRYPNFIGKIQHINLGIFSCDALLDKKYVLWVARCEKWKRPDFFLEIATVLNKVPFIMICPRQENDVTYFEGIKRKAENLPNVTFVEFVPFKDIQPYFNGAKVFINTSDFEGFTYTLVQSGLARTPVVYLSVNPDEVITRYDMGYVSGGSKEDMIEQIKKLLQDERDWSGRSENIFRYVKENHDINIVGEQWKKLLEGI